MMKKVIIILLGFCVSLSGDFVQKWYIGNGGYGGYGAILVGDSNHDLNPELLFIKVTLGAPVFLYEHIDSVWYLTDTLITYPPTCAPWAMGDFDLDGLTNVVYDFHTEDPGLADGILIYESPDSFSYPTQEVWRDTVGFALVQPISVYDVDQDSFPEIFKLGWRKEDSITIYYPFGIYESVGDNQYDTIFMGTGLGSLSSTIAFGDFDSDGLNEFVIGNIDGKYQLWECIENNNYQLLEQQQLPTVNIKDCFSVPDADGDGKLEFVVKGFTPLDARTHAFIFEAIGDNTYEIIKSYNLAGGDYYGGYSEAGDVDGDSIPEIVLESASYVYIIKSAGNDSFYIWDTLPGHASGSNVRIFDIDGNGLAEIIISGNNETRIYEYNPGGIEETALRLMPDALRLEVFPNPFSKLTKISFGKGHGAMGIELKIYDVSGRLVKSLYRGIINSNHTLTWKGNDDYGRIVAQGVYFIRFENVDSDKTVCKKVLKVK